MPRMRIRCEYCNSPNWYEEVLLCIRCGAPLPDVLKEIDEAMQGSRPPQQVHLEALQFGAVTCTTAWMGSETFGVTLEAPKVRVVGHVNYDRVP